MDCNWDDPADRLRLIEEVGAEAYTRALQEHIRTSRVATVNGYHIRPVGSRFGRLFVVEGSQRAFATLAEAEAHAHTLAAGPAI